MSFEQIVLYSLYSVAFFVVIKVLLFFRRIYKKYIRRVLFFRTVLIEEWEEYRKRNELYQEKKQKELIKRQEMLREKQNQSGEIQRVYKEDLEIVDIAKPVGNWTKMVMLGGELMKRLAQLINREGGKKGYWELRVKAQASTQGKYKGKGR